MDTWFLLQGNKLKQKYGKCKRENMFIVAWFFALGFVFLVRFDFLGKL